VEQEAKTYLPFRFSNQTNLISTPKADSPQFHGVDCIFKHIRFLAYIVQQLQAEWQDSLKIPCPALS
jgi:hypothetical protein